MHNEGVDCLAARAAQRKQSGNYYVPIFGRLFGAQRANISDLGGKTCHCTGCGNTGIWEYDGLFITLGWGGENNRGAEVGLVEVLLRVSLEVILHHLLRQLGSHSPGRGLSGALSRAV